jgi:hypothetical protein
VLGKCSTTELYPQPHQQVTCWLSPVDTRWLELLLGLATWDLAQPSPITGKSLRNGIHQPMPLRSKKNMTPSSYQGSRG